MIELGKQYLCRDDEQDGGVTSVNTNSGNINDTEIFENESNLRTPTNRNSNGLFSRGSFSEVRISLDTYNKGNVAPSTPHALSVSVTAAGTTTTSQAEQVHPDLLTVPPTREAASSVSVNNNVFVGKHVVINDYFNQIQSENELQHNTRRPQMLTVNQEADVTDEDNNHIYDNIGDGNESREKIESPPSKTKPTSRFGLVEKLKQTFSPRK